MPNIPEALAGGKFFPVLPGDKLPALSSGWQTRATNDPAQLAEWDRGMSNLNWGVACGPSGLFVIDIDPQGLKAWQEIQAKVPGLKEAVARSYTVRTPRGGFHHYFRGYGPTTASQIAPGIDTRGGYLDERTGKMKSTGYVVLPGSRTVAGAKTVDGEYSYVSGSLEDMPAPVLQIVPEKKKGATLGLEGDVTKDNPRNVQTVRDLLGKYVEDGRVSVEGSGGDNTCFQVVASVLDKGISPAKAFELLDEMWNPHCSPPWEDYELETKILNALKYGEETGEGAKGFLDNATAFSKFVGMELPPEPLVHRKGRFKPMRLDEARLDVREASWLIPGFIPSLGTGILYGLSGSYKTFVALDWALTLAHGLAGQWGAPPVKHNVLFLAGESAYALQQERVDSWCEWQGVKPEDGNFVIVRGVPAYGDKEGWEEIRDGLLEMDFRPTFIVIDTLTRIMSGMDENSNNDAKRVLKHLEEMSQHYGAFALATGHTGKDESRGLRGAQVFIDNSDAVIYAKKSESGTVLKIKKLKEVDIPDAPFYFDKVTFGKSIVLRRTEIAPANEAKQSSKTSWSDPAELSQIIAKNGGRISHSALVMEITSNLQIEDKKVQRELRFRPDIQDMRDGHYWIAAVPAKVLEFDL